jgi:hypothetical protein
MLIPSSVCIGIQAYQVKQPWGELRLKLDLTPEEGTKGSNTLGTFSEYCFAHEGSSHQHRLSRAMRSCILKGPSLQRWSAPNMCRKSVTKELNLYPHLGFRNGIVSFPDPNPRTGIWGWERDYRVGSGDETRNEIMVTVRSPYMHTNAIIPFRSSHTH